MGLLAIQTVSTTARNSGTLGTFLADNESYGGHETYHSHQLCVMSVAYLISQLCTSSKHLKIALFKNNTPRALSVGCRGRIEQTPLRCCIRCCSLNVNVDWRINPILGTRRAGTFISSFASKPTRRSFRAAIKLPPLSGKRQGYR